MNTPNYRKFRTNEYAQFFQDVYTICTANNPISLKIETQTDSLNQINISLADVFKKNYGSEITEKVVYYDNRRDEAIICLRKLADGYTNHFNEAYKESALRILHTIDKYGSQIYKLNYQAETSTLKNLASDLRNTPQLWADVEKLMLTEIIQEIETMNNECNNYYLQRIQETAANVSEPAREVIKEGKKQYKILVDHIMAHATLTPSEAYSNLINEINALIDKYNSTVTSRGGSETVIENQDIENVV